MRQKSVADLSIKEILRSLIGPPDFSRKNIQEYLAIILGALIQALAMRLFLIPAQLVSGGISGIAQIINHFTGWPIGLMVFLATSHCLFWAGIRGGPRFAKRTALSILLFSVFTDGLALSARQRFDR